MVVLYWKQQGDRDEWVEVGGRRWSLMRCVGVLGSPDAEAGRKKKRQGSTGRSSVLGREAQAEAEGKVGKH